MSNRGGHCMLLSSGQACSYPMKGTHAKYGCFAYSSAFGYSVPPGLFTLEQYALASQLGFSDDGGEYWKTRRLSSYAAIETREDGPVLVSVWTPFSDVTVRTILVPSTDAAPNWHLRVHRISVKEGPADRAIMTADGAFAIHNENAQDGRYLGPYDAATGEGTQPKIIGNYDTLTPDGWARGHEGAFAVCRDSGAVGIRSLESALETGREANLVNADPNSNLIHSRTVIPTLQHTLRSGQTVWYVTAVYAKPAGPNVAAESFLDGWASPPELPAWLQAEIAENKA